MESAIRGLEREARAVTATGMLFFAGALCLLALFAAARGPFTASDGSSSPPAAADFSSMRLSFEPNVGQAGPATDFVARSGHGSLLLSATQATFVRAGLAPLRVRLAGGDRGAPARAEHRLPGTVNYLVGARSAWHAGVPTFSQVHYSTVYPGIDVRWHGARGGAVEYDFAVAPGADPRRISLSFPGAERLAIAPGGALLIRSDGGTVRQSPPRALQDGREVPTLYTLDTNSRVGIAVGRYDHSAPLLIDPVLGSSTFLGGSDFESANGIAVGPDGSIYVTGQTTSTDFPTTPGAFDGAKSGFSDAFVSKLNPEASALMYSTYLGGSDTPTGEIAHGVAVTRTGEAVITGVTGSSDFPTTPGAVQATYGGAEDAFLTKLSPDGSSLEYSTFLGGSNLDLGRDLVLDGRGAAYVTGLTHSDDYPTTVGSYSPTCGEVGCLDAFVTKVDPTGSSLVYSSFLGGPANEDGGDIAIDPQRNAYVTGTTGSTNFPTRNAFQTTCVGCEFGESDAFVTEFNAPGSHLRYSSYLGGSQSDFGRGIDVGADGSAYIAGETESSDASTKPFPTTPGAFDTTSNGIPDAFASKVAPGGAPGGGLLYSTYLGGSVADEAFAVKANSLGQAYITGSTRSTDFPVVDPVQAICGCTGAADAFVTKLNAAGSSLDYSTFLGDISRDEGYDLFLYRGSADVTGITHSRRFPTTRRALKRFNDGGDADAFISRLDDAAPECTITGTNGDDVLTGSSADDVICGRGGNDTESGRGGQDLLIGASGDDTLTGGGGADMLLGGGGSDTLHTDDAVNGNDTLDCSRDVDSWTADPRDALIACP